jgi:hypothetical protein
VGRSPALAGALDNHEITPAALGGLLDDGIDGCSSLAFPGSGFEVPT